MPRFVATRALEMIPVLLVISFAAFLLIHLVPGDPAQVQLGPHASPQQIAALHSQLGLDKPWPAQYWDFVSGAVHFDFGTSLRTQESVGNLIGRRLGPSFLLIGMALAISVVLAVPLATIAARRRHTWIDQTIRLGSTVTFVMPAFWLALLLVLVFSLQLGLLPPSGYGNTLPEHIRSLILPAVTLSLALAPVLLRLLRSSEIEVMQSEYIEAARARGLGEARIIVKHVLRNSATSTVTLIAYLIGVLLSLTVVVETIFSIPGLGSLLVSAVQQRDFPVVQALTLVFAVVVVLVSLVTDLIYAMLDPRVRL